MIDFSGPPPRSEKIVVSVPEYLAVKTMVMALIAERAATLNADGQDGASWAAAMRQTVVDALASAPVVTGDGRRLESIQREAIEEVGRIFDRITF